MTLRPRIIQPAAEEVAPPPPARSSFIDEAPKLKPRSIPNASEPPGGPRPRTVAPNADPAPSEPTASAPHVRKVTPNVYDPGMAVLPAKPRARTVSAAPPEPPALDPYTRTAQARAPNARTVTSRPTPPAPMRPMEIETSYIAGQRAHLPAEPPRPPPAPPVDYARLDALHDKARAANPELAESHRFRPRLQMLMEMRPNDWLNWGAAGLDAVRTGSEQITQIANTFRQIDSDRLCDECRRLAGKVPNMLERLTIKDKPAFYTARLEGMRAELNTMLNKVSGMKDTLVKPIETLGLDALALQVILDGVNDPTQAAIGHNRHRLLVNVNGDGLNLRQTLETTEAAIVTAIGNIDVLLNGVLPSWARAVAAL